MAQGSHAATYGQGLSPRGGHRGGHNPAELLELYRRHLERIGADLEAFVERAAIRQYCGRQSREAAELGAYLEACARHGAAPEKPPKARR